MSLNRDLPLNPFHIRQGYRLSGPQTQTHTHTHTHTHKIRGPQRPPHTKYHARWCGEYFDAKDISHPDLATVEL